MRCFVLVFLLGSSFALRADQLRCPAPVTRLEMDSGDYSPMEGVTFGLHNFAANMVVRGKRSPLCFNRTTEIEHGSVLATSESLSRMFQRKTEQSGSNISDVKVELKDGAAHISGKVKKGIDVPFDIEGPISTDGTVLILDAKKIKAEHIPIKGLLSTVGAHLSSLLKSESAEGVQANGNQLIFSPEQISHVRGHISSAQVTAKGLLITFEVQKKTASSERQKTSAKQQKASPEGEKATSAHRP